MYENFSQDIDATRKLTAIATEELDLIDENQSAHLSSLIDEAESLEHTDSPALVRSFFRRNQENLGWSLDLFDEKFKDAIPIYGTRINNAISIAASQLKDIREEDEITEEGWEYAHTVFNSAIQAALYEIVLHATNDKFEPKNVSTDMEAVG